MMAAKTFFFFSPLIFGAVSVLACNMKAQFEILKETQCNSCSGLGKDKCGGVEDCDWAAQGGCRPAARVSLFSDLLAASEDFGKANILLDVGKACSLHLDSKSCYADPMCMFKDSIDTDVNDFLMSGGTRAHCKMADTVFFTILMSFVDGSSDEELNRLLESQRVCRKIGHADCKAQSRSQWLKHKSLAKGDFLCSDEEESGVKRCDLDIGLVYLKIAQLSEEKGWEEAARDAVACGVLDSDACGQITGCELKSNDDECEIPESVFRKTADGPKARAYFALKDECEAITTNSTCTAAPDCGWDEEDGECGLPADMGEIGVLLNIASGNDELAWLEKFLRNFKTCEDLTKDDTCTDNQDCYKKCSANKECYYTAPMGGKGKGKCNAHYNGAIPFGVPDAQQCATALSEAVHAGLACEVQETEQDCKKSAHHPGYSCSWVCGTCLPAPQYFPEISPVAKVTTTPMHPTTTAVKTKGDNDREKSDDHDIFKRKLKVEVKKSNVKIESKRKSGGTEEELEFQFKAGSGGKGFEVKMEYEKETKAKEKIRLRCPKLLKVNLANTTIGYQVGDNIINTKDLNKGTWKDIACSDVTESDEEGNDVSVKSCMMETADVDFTIFRLTAEVAGDVFTKKIGTLKRKVKPTSTKLTFDWNGTVAAGEYWVLMCDVQTGSRSKSEKETRRGDVDGDNDEEKVTFGDTGASFFSWETSATDENAKDINVIASPLVTDGFVKEKDDEDVEVRRSISFTFLASNIYHINWDPQVGAGEQLTGSEEAPFSSAQRVHVTAAAALCAAIVTLW